MGLPCAGLPPESALRPPMDRVVGSRAGPTCLDICDGITNASYVRPAVLWISYAATVVFSDEWFAKRRTTWIQWFETLTFYALVVFVLINHLLPVY